MVLTHIYLKENFWQATKCITIEIISTMEKILVINGGVKNEKSFN